jgi:ABC-type branched-subunit amino acid transport system substrate-binding protein
MRIRTAASCLPILLIAFGCGARPLSAEDGITDKAVLVGQCAALEGPAAGLGTGMHQGMKACFDAVNAAGGVNGRTLTLVAVDDGYDPDKCIDGTVKLIEEDKVFALAGYVGTPTVKAALPVISDKKVPLVGLFTGAMIFRQPVNRYVFSLRASYNDETEMLVEHLVKDLGVGKIAVFYQNDSFGQSGLAGVEKALAKRSLAVVGKGTFERNTLAVKSGLAAVVASAPEAVVMVGPYKPIAAFVKEARAAGLAVPLATISFVGTENLIKELADAANGLIISQVVPSPDDAAIPLVKEYREAIAKSFPDAAPSYVGLEGFVTGKLFALGLAKAGAAPTREGLADALEGLAASDLGGMTVKFGKDDHQASDLVFLTQVSGGKAKPAAALVK